MTSAIQLCGAPTSAVKKLRNNPHLPKPASTLDPASSTKPVPSTMSCSRPTSTNRTTAAADKLPSVRTVLSKSSKIFHKLSTINLAASASKRRSSSGGSMSNNNNLLGSLTNLRPMLHLRTSTLSVFSATNTPGPGPNGSPDHHQQLHPAHSQFIHQHPPAHRPDYLPSKKTRNGVPRSADFLALRFVSLSHDDQILGHHHQS
ncbi:hypothetical protein PtA15_1A679 [Puccinia triticina]|uniref:Uncharacterized protein n=1 Tax=Puccinia triticina TaxID=208348 RepID=A0ABY7C9H8_9BASI|nr:uncharacterized protein PtA15_1A679 [Puccinia triticina]WAQ81339.1 hypothetical protein PtA15_1A679 [Puccinia triticina]